MDENKMVEQYRIIRKQILDLSRYYMYKPKVETVKRKAEVEMGNDVVKRHKE